MINRLASIFITLLATCSVAYAAVFQDGEKAFKAKDYNKAAAIWQQLANQNDAASQISLAGMYTIGLGVDKNLDKAFNLYQRAAEQGSAEAQNKLGKIYAAGQGVTRDPGKAREWYIKAAKQGDAEAIYNTGVSYFRGEGVATDYVTAHAWIHVAVTMGYEAGESYRDQLAEVLSKEKLEQSKQISKRLMDELKNKKELTIP